MEHTRFSYQIAVREFRLTGPTRFFAKVAHLQERTGSGDKPVRVPFTIRYGATAEEAKAKLDGNVRAWIAQQLDSVAAT